MVVFDALVAGHLRRRGPRAFATAVAVALGVALYLTLRLADAHAVAAFDAQTGAFGDEADFAVLPTAGGSLDARLLARIRSVAGVATATPALEGDALVSGEVVHVAGRDLLAPLPRTEEFRTVLPGPFAPVGSGPDPAELIDGRGAFVSEPFAARHRIRLGDAVPATAGTMRLDLRASAVVPRSALLDPGTIVVDVATAQALFGRAGRLDRIDVVAASGDRDAARARVAAVVPGDATVVSAGERRASVVRMAGGFSFDLALLGALALLAAILLAADAVGISVVQRREEIATLRVLGTTRSAIARAFLIEGALFGTIGGLFGAVAGSALGDAGGSVAAGTDALARDPGAPVVALLAGTVLGACGALPPAVTAAAGLPGRALRPPPAPARPQSGLRASAVAGIATGSAAAIALARALSRPAEATAWGAIACAAVVVAAALVFPWIVARASRVGSIRFPNAPAPAMLALANVRAMPRRIALAAGALAAGAALATTALVLSASLGDAVAALAARSFPGDLVVTPREGAGAAASARFPSPAVARIAALDGIASVRATRTIVVAFRGAPVRVEDAGPPQRAPSPGRVDVAIDSAVAARTGLAVGGEFALPTARGELAARVSRIDDADEAGSPGTIALEPHAFARAYDDDTADAIDIALRPHADAVRIVRLVRAILAPRVVEATTSADLRARLLARFAPIVGETFAIATLALGMGALGLATALVGLALERGDDIRLLRLAGLSRRGVRAMIVCEAAALGAFGGATGIVAGIVLAAVALAVDRAAFGWSIAIVVPFASIGITFVAAVALAGLVGIAPARLASRIGTGRARRIAVAFVAALALATATLAPGPASAADDTGTRARTTDVWRVLGHLRARDGSRYDVSTTFFRYALVASGGAAPSPAFDAAALSIVDDGERRTVTGVRVDREGGGLAHAGARDLDLRVDDWTLAATGRARATLREGEGDVAFDATLVDVGGALAVTDGALRPRAAGCALCLAPGFALPRLAATGTLRIGTRRIAVRGFFWIDRETTRGVAPRNAFAWRFVIALDDGRVVFVRATRRRDDGSPLAASGFVRATDGTVRYFSAPDVSVEDAVGTTWRSARDDVYPSLFEAIVRPMRLDFALVPVVQDQEIDGGERGLPFYDGALDVERAHPGPRDTGAGFVELSGYAGAVRPSP